MLEKNDAALPHRWMAGDDEMGRPYWFRRRLEALGERYMLAGPSNTSMRDVEGGSCTCPLRINTAGALVNYYRDKKVYTRGLSWHPSSPFTPRDALKAGRADTRPVWSKNSCGLVPHNISGAPRAVHDTASGLGALCPG